jgi:hypothetical protein
VSAEGNNHQKEQRSKSLGETEKSSYKIKKSKPISGM